MQNRTESGQGLTPPSGPQPSAAQIDALIDQAVEALNQGDLQTSLRCLDTVVAADAHQFDAWNLLAVIALQQRDFKRAIDLLGRAIAVDPEVAMAHVNLGVAWMESGHPDKAQPAFEQAIALDPEEPGAALGLGVALLALQQWAGAADLLGRALAQNPANAEAQFNRGNALNELGRHEDAIACFDQALALQAEHVGALLNRAHACMALHRHEEAIKNCQQAHALQPDRASAFVILGDACMAIHAHAEALASYERALLLQPGQFAPLINRGNALLKLGRPEEAIASFEQGLALQPAHATALSNLAGALREAERWDEAWSRCEQALAIEPAHPGALMNMGNVLLDQAKLTAAREAFAKVVSLQPDNADAQWAQGWCDLLAGDWARGLPQLEWRWKRASFTSPVRQFSKPLWLGQADLRGRTILLHAEQGLGDTLQFSRYATLLHALGARVLLEVPAPLKQLMRSVPGVSQVLVKGEGFLPPFDFHCPLMSLPLALKTTPGTVPCPGPYLQAAEALCEDWAEHLGPHNAPRVGLVWSGNAAHRNDRLRSMSAAALLQAIPPGIELYALQKDIRESDRPALLARGVQDLSARLNTMEDTAALIHHMDLVISVDTSVAHLAGALGKPTWILLSRMPDWRWLMQRADTPWYGRARLLRQGQWGRWDDVLAQVQQSLHMELAPAPSQWQ